MSYESILFKMMELVEIEDKEEAVAQAIELIKQEPEIIEQVLYNIAVDLLTEAQDKKPMIDAYEEFKNEKGIIQ